MLSALATYYDDLNDQGLYNSYDTYSDHLTNSSAYDVGYFFGFMFVFMLPLLVCAVLTIIGMWKVFKKAGKPGWAVLVPIYNIIVMLEIVGRPTWWVFLFFLGIIPFVGWIGSLVVGIIVANDLAKAFGKDVGYTLLLIFLPFVGYMILGLSKDAVYKGVPKHAQ